MEPHRASLDPRTFLGGAFVNLSRERLLREAAATGFRPSMLEKVARLLALLDGFNAHPFLKGKLALKGGTALNLFVFDVPRLSVDIDLNYIALADREGMMAERPKIEQAVVAVCEREGFQTRRVPTEHAGGKLMLRYQGALGDNGNLEVDLNFLLRVPLVPVLYTDSKPVGAFRATKVPVLDLHELAAGKLAALLARRASRDLFDSHALLGRDDLDLDLLRVLFVAYGGMNRKDWREVAVKDVDLVSREVDEQLLPLLRGDALETWQKSAPALVAECRKRLKAVLPLRKNERKFLDRLLDEGQIEPALLTDDAKLAERIAIHPALAWKALNVKEHRKGR
jgi:predicted nucleotidyltransferase component of viral defense system